MGAGFADGYSRGFAFVTAEVVCQHDVAWQKRWHENLFNVDQETLAIDGTVEQPRRLDAIMSERGDERHGIPMAVGRFRFEPFSYRRPAAQSCHVGLGPGLVDEDESGRINAMLIARPSGAHSSYVGTILLFGQQRFF